MTGIYHDDQPTLGISTDWFCLVPMEYQIGYVKMYEQFVEIFDMAILLGCN